MKRLGVTRLPVAMGLGLDVLLVVLQVRDFQAASSSAVAGVYRLAFGRPGHMSSQMSSRNFCLSASVSSAR